MRRVIGVNPAVVGSLSLVAILATAQAGCSTSPSRSQGAADTSVTTGSLAPAPPPEGMLRTPPQPYGDGYNLGRNDYVPPAAAARQGQYQWNGNPSRIQQGTGPQLPAQRPIVAADGRSTIVVRPGDTLYSIARDHSVPMNDLIAANRLNGPALKAGQTLVLPSKYR